MTPIVWATGGAIAGILVKLARARAPGAPGASLAPWRQAILDRASWHVQQGTLYEWGGGHGGGTYGLDCSGLVIDACKAAGFVMQWNSGSMWELLPHVASPQPADLCLYGSGGKATHVTIVEKLTPDGLVAIIGENGGGSNTTTPATAKAQGAFAKRVPTHLYRSGFLGFCSLVDIAEGRVSAKMF